MRIKIEKSVNGWPASKNPAVIDVKVFTVVAGLRPVKVRVAAAVAPLILAALKEWHKRVEKLEPGEVQGYCYRDVRGGKSLSNHSSATAVDIAPYKHPQGDEDGNFTKEQQATIREICKKYGLKSGGDYKAPTKRDWMHIEVNVTPKRAAELIKELNLEVLF